MNDRDRGADWEVRIVEQYPDAVIHVSRCGSLRRFGIRSGECLDLRIVYTKVDGPQVLFMRHGPDSTK